MRPLCLVKFLCPLFRTLFIVYAVNVAATASEQHPFISSLLPSDLYLTFFFFHFVVLPSSLSIYFFPFTTFSPNTDFYCQYIYLYFLFVHRSLCVSVCAFTSVIGFSMQKKNEERNATTNRNSFFLSVCERAKS